MFKNTYNKGRAGLQPRTYFTRSFIFYDYFCTLGTPEKVCYSFFCCNVSSKNLLSLFLCFFRKSCAPYLFLTNWLLIIVIDKFTITEFSILIRKLSFLVPPSTLGGYIYGASVMLRKGIFQISHGWLLRLLLFWFTYLYRRYSGKAWWW